MVYQKLEKIYGQVYLFLILLLSLLIPGSLAAENLSLPSFTTWSQEIQQTPPSNFGIDASDAYVNLLYGVTVWNDDRNLKYTKVWTDIVMPDITDLHLSFDVEAWAVSGGVSTNNWDYGLTAKVENLATGVAISFIFDLDYVRPGDGYTWRLLGSPLGTWNYTLIKMNANKNRGEWSVISPDLNQHFNPGDNLTISFTNNLLYSSTDAGPTGGSTSTDRIGAIVRVVPEPSTSMLFLLGLIATFGIQRKHLDL